MEREQIGVVTHVDVAYPEALIQHLPKEWLPYFLFYRGDLSILTEPTLAIFGGVSPSSRAQEMSDALAELLTRERYPVIRSKEEWYDFRIFTGHFGDSYAVATVGQWVSW